jgi:hypothetical protein
LAQRWLLPTLVFVVAFLPRLAPLDRYVTPDEPVWVYRSLRFSQALTTGDLDAISDAGHPGVTTMWLGTLGFQVHRWLEPDLAAAHLDWLDGLAGLSPESAAAFGHLIDFLSGGRLFVALATSLGLVAIFTITRHLWGLPVALLGALLLALDPFLIGHSGLLHLDGLLATTMTLSVLAALSAVCESAVPKRTPGDMGTRQSSGRGRGTWHLYGWVALSGLMGGLALLTKTPGGFLAPFAGILLAAAWLTRRLSWQQAMVGLAVWALSAGLTVVLLYPALWVNPISTLRGWLDLGGRQVTGPLRPIFFHGQLTYDPGATFYPVVWLFRVSPLVLFGLPCALVAHVRRSGPVRFAVVALVALALGFGLFITLVGKKHDRYLLPAFPPLTLVAALGWEWAGRSVKGRFVNRTGTSNLPVPNLRIFASWLSVAAVVAAQLFLVLIYVFTPLAYFNPLLGGPRAALDWLPVGWGEGLGAAARWLNQQPEAERLIVAASSIPPFASLFVGRSVLLDEDTLSQVDYIVNSPQPGPGQTLFEHQAQNLVYDYKVGEIRYASVFRSPVLDEQATYLNDRARRGDLIVLDAEAALDRLYTGPADMAVLADARNSSQVAADLDALTPGHENLWYVALPVASPITAQHIQGQLSCRGRLVYTDTISGATIYQIALDDPQDLPSCAATPGAPSPLPSCGHASAAAGGAREGGAARFGDALAFTGVLLPSEPIAWPDPLSLVVRWEALTPFPVDYRVVLYLKDETERIWAEAGQEILDADYRRPSAWMPGDWNDQTFYLALPPAIPPGCYSLALGVFDPVRKMGLSAWDTAGEFAGLAVNLGQISIAPPSNQPTPWDVALAERFDPPSLAGPLALLGYNPPPAHISSGERASFDLLWQAAAPPGFDYTLRWRLMPFAGSGALTETAPLSPYSTARWRDQELERVRYDLGVPPDLPAGDYTLVINVLDVSGAPLWTEDIILAQVEILARDRLFTLPADITYPLALRLGDVVHLRGFDLLPQAQDDVGTLSARPGDRIPLKLYWQADGPTDLSYTVFVHLVGPDGMLHGQVDRPPAGGAAPTHSWAPEQVVIDEIVLPVLPDAPLGAYQIAVGLYDPVSGERLPVYDVAGAELFNRQIVLPVEVTVE